MISNVFRWTIVGLLTFSLVQAQEIKGTPGVDYPNFATVPDSSFKCSDQELIPGFYADPEAQCQAYHYCSEEGQETFLCPVGSTFNQAKLACDAWYNSNCSLASQSYSLNSGPLLENAMKNVPLLIKIRNRAKNRLSFRVPATDESEKITPLHDGSNDSNDVEREQSPDTSEDQGEQLNEGESLDDILSRLEANIQNDEHADGVYDENSDASEGASDDKMQTNIFFDPVTEQYYMDPESSENEWSQKFNDDQYGFYDSEDFAYKYGLAMQDEDSRDGAPMDLYGMNNEDIADDRFLNHQMDLEQPFRRLRRKPVYTVVRDQLPIGMREDTESIDSEEVIGTESIAVVTDASSEPSAEINTETQRGTYTMAPFEMVEDLSRMHMTPTNITEEPMTSEEFEGAIISELIQPKIDEHDLRVIGSTSDQEQPNEGYADPASSDVQNNGYTYVENESPGQSEYSNLYDAENENRYYDIDSRVNDQIDEENYQDDERLDEDTGKSDTFVVIPDESEIQEFSEAFDTSASTTDSEYQDSSDENSNEDASARDYDYNIPRNYASQDAYSVSDQSQYRTPQYSPSVEYGPEQYFQQGYFNPEIEEQGSPYDYTDGSYVADQATAMGSEYNQYGVQAPDAANQFMYASPASYACQTGYTNCMYGAQAEYPYAGYYHNPYVGNYPYGVSDVEESSELPVPDEGSYSSESPMSYMIQRDPDMNSEQFEMNQNYEQPNLYQDQNLDEGYPAESLPDNSGGVLENSNVDKETYYVLGDDEESTSEGDSESVTEQSSLKIDYVSDATGNQGETFYVLEDEDEERVMEDGSEVEAFADVSEKENIEEQQVSSQDKPLPSEESSQGDFVHEMPSQTADKDASPSEENSLGDDRAESASRSTMDSKYIPVTNGGSFAAKSDRNGDVLLTSGERFGQNDETSKVLLSSRSNLPNMFLNNMAYSDLSNFGPHGFGSNLGQTMMASSPSSFSSTKGGKRTGNSVSPNVSKLSALQERIRSLKQGKFGAFKKIVSSGSKN